MNLKDQIRADMISAMKSKDETLRNTLKLLLSSFTNFLVANGQTPQSEISDTDAMSVIKKSVKQRKDAIEQYSKGGRQDLVETEQAELDILEKYLPAKMDESKLEEIVKKKIEELKITDKTKSGPLIGAVLKETDGQAEASDIKKIIDSILS